MIVKTNKLIIVIKISKCLNSLQDVLSRIKRFIEIVAVVLFERIKNLIKRLQNFYTN